MRNRYLSLLFALFLPFISLGQAPQGLFLNDYQPKQAVIPPFVDYQPPTKTPTTTITVDVKDTLALVSKYLFGNNANVYMMQMVDQPDLLRSIRTLSPNIIRFPGGNLSSVFFWNAPKDQSPADAPDTLTDAEGKKFQNQYWFGGNTDSWTLSVDNYYRMLEQTGNTGIITINYAYARYGTGPTPVQTAAKLAADWVRYDKGRTKYWEIGNESGGTWQAGYRIDPTKNQDGQPTIITGELYGAHFTIFADSMRKAAAEIGSTIYIGAQMIQAEPASWATQTDKTWNAGFFQSAGNGADFFIVHSYYTPYGENSTPEQILATPVSETKGMVDYVKKTVVAAGAQMKPMALTEWNIFAEGSQQYVSYVNGMHAAMTLGELIKNQYGMASRWDLANGWNAGNDHGMFSQGGEPGVPLWNPRPVFYYMYYFQKYFGDHMVSSDVSGSTDIVSYASVFSSGQVGMVVVNKGSKEETVSLNLLDYGYGDRYYGYSLTGGTDNGNFSRKVLVNGQGTSLPAGGPANVETLPAQSARIGSGVKFTAPPRSVQYLLIENGTNPVVLGREEEQNQWVNVYPNPALEGTFQLELKGGSSQQTVEFSLVDSKGRVLHQQAIPATGIFTFRRPVARGFYLIRVHTPQGVVSRKLAIP